MLLFFSCSYYFNLAVTLNRVAKKPGNLEFDNLGKKNLEFERF